jgi:hypothetical protein
MGQEISEPSDIYESMGELFGYKAVVSKLID